MAIHAPEIERADREFELRRKRADEAAVEVIHAVLPTVAHIAASLPTVRDYLAAACVTKGDRALGPGHTADALRHAYEAIDAAIDGLVGITRMINESLEDDDESG